MIRRTVYTLLRKQHNFELERFSSIAINAVVHRRGDDSYGSREYLLLPLHIDLDQADEYKLASLHAHRNIVFGAKSFGHKLVEACTPLLEKALLDCGENGEQPQAISTLHGLCQWVAAGFESKSSSAGLLQELKHADPVAYDAVKAIATGVPRPGHSVVGQGTFRDGGTAWEKLARAFVENEPSSECQLYLQAGAHLVGIESLADTKPDYIKSAGGAMARFFFL